MHPQHGKDLLSWSDDPRKKGIPYPSEMREDGSINHGFVPLKCRPQDSWNIVEVGDEPELLRCLQRLNAGETAFFTVGCEKDYNERDGTARPIGYIEVCFNSIENAGSDVAYSTLYEAFRRNVLSMEDPPAVRYDWNLARVEIGGERICAYSCAVFLKTVDRSDTQHATKVWRSAVGYLTDYLAGWPQGREPLFFPMPVA